MMKTQKINILHCGNSNTFGMKIKILDTEPHGYKDCLYTLIFEGVEYGIDDADLLISHNFIECNMLRNDIQSALEIFKDEKNIFDLTSILKNISIEEAIKQIIRYHYCRGMQDELVMNYNYSIDNFINQILEEESHAVTFVLNSHDSMRHYYLIPFFIDNDFYLGIARSINGFDNFDCSDSYNWGLSMCTYKKINKKDFINVLECAKNFLD